MTYIINSNSLPKEHLQMSILFGDAGNDNLQGGAGIDLLIGFEGDDTISGGDQFDILIGNKGDDVLQGDKGNDLMFAGQGDDRMIWNNGDGSDLMEGGSGRDTVEVNGANAAGDDFRLEANGERTQFDRLNLIPFTLDVDNVEKFEINGNGGDDNVDINDLSGTDVEKVVVTGGDGNDTVDASDSATPLEAFGDAGDDLLKGSSEVDTLKGGDGSDTLVGNKGDDQMFGKAGDDRFIWNNGDGSDLMEGGNGVDTFEVNGSVDQGDDFLLEANEHRVKFQRNNLGLFELDIDDTEQAEINGSGGDDTLTVNDLSGTDLEAVTFNGGDGNDIVDASNSATPLEAFGDAGDDQLIGGTANDTLSGGAGNDSIEGEQGDDTMIGGEGNDTLEWDDGDGSDLMSGGEGIDVIEVEGSLAEGDEFVLGQDGTTAIFDRVNLGQFTLTVDTSEEFEVAGEGGDDSFIVNDLSATDVELVKFDGGEGNDTLDASHANVPIIADGGAGDDLLIGSTQDDQLLGGDGNDTLIGNGGFDVLIGGAGNDLLIAEFDGDISTFITIEGFDTSADMIQLNGMSSNYVTNSTTEATGIYVDSNGDGTYNDGVDELVARVVGASSIDLNASYIDYV
jgi:Ca2+-binding RTX toxin-like protein